MHQNLILRRLLFFALSGVAIIALATLVISPVTTAAQESDTQGALQVLDPSGKPKARCPLKHTAVNAEISGFLARVVVTQEFTNPFKEKIEAVYTFPLPQNAAVDDMTMLVGDRVVRGKILRREDAEAVYETAKSSGQVASLLNQERPNIFTQSVANIMPGEQVKITISYVETLKYENGSYAFVFPMVVGPRYVPGSPSSSPSRGNGFAPDTDEVPDASRITPRAVPKGMRVGHDISLDINLDAGVPIDNLSSGSHEVETQRPGMAQARVRLKNNSVIPNKDFILRYDVAGPSISDALLTHRADKGGFFTFILQPPERITTEDVTPKELVFVLDTSGSMSGFPIEKAKETMKLALDNLYPGDTFNLITFSGDTYVLFPTPVPASPENLKKAQAFLASRAGGGGTEMMKAIKAALDPSNSQAHVRVVCFMTDGFVGNDMEIIAEVAKHPNARVFAFGIGSSVNRFLLDKMAEYGRGEVEYVGLNDDGSAAARRFHERIRNPLLTDISIDWNGLPVTDVYPERISDLFGAKPVILTGRYTAPSAGTFRLKGKMSGREFIREIPVSFPESMAHHDVLASLWARSRIDNLTGQDHAGMQSGLPRPDLKEIITNLGLEFRLMTQFTSFVAVEEMIVTDGGQPRRIDVPVEVPEGVNRSAVYGAEFGGVNLLGQLGRSHSNFLLVDSSVNASRSTVNRRVKASSRTATGKGVGAGEGGGIGPGRGGNIGGGDFKAGGGGPGGGGGGGGRAAGGSGTNAGSGPGNRSGGAAPAPTPVPNSPGPATITFSGGLTAASALVISEEEKRRFAYGRMHPSLLAVIERVKTGALPSADEAKFVRGGKAEVRIWLTEKSEEVMAELKKLGFEIVLEPKTAKLVIGRLPVESLKKLSELQWVKFAAPQKI